MKWTLADVWGVFAFVLMMAGIVGLSWEIFREGGWGGQLLGLTWGGVVSKPAVVVPALLIGGGIAALLLRARGNAAQTGKHPFSEFLVYALMALGLFFIYRALT